VENAKAEAVQALVVEKEEEIWFLGAAAAVRYLTSIELFAYTQLSLPIWSELNWPRFTGPSDRIRSHSNRGSFVSAEPVTLECI